MSNTEEHFTNMMPEYISHTKARALKIKDIHANPIYMDGVHLGSNFTLVFEDDSYPPFSVTENFMKRSHCAVGGYLIKYFDGYLSWTPAKVFEEGFTPVSKVMGSLTLDEISQLSTDALGGYPETTFEQLLALENKINLMKATR